MNDRQIYALMAKTPDIRAVQICDALDAELTDVSAALRSLVEIGDVVKHSGTAPNNQPAQLYNLSETFKKSREGVALLASVAPAAQPAPAADLPEPAQQPAPAPQAFPTPVFTQQDVLKKERTKAELAIDHLTANTSATDAEMRIVLGIPGKNAPRAYLRAQLNTGALLRWPDGVWTLGGGTPPASHNSPRAEPATTTTNKEAAPMPPITPPPTTEGAAAPVFRCGLWSDGVLELQRNGQQVAVLNQREGEQLVDFMGRMLGQVEKVAA